MSDETTVDLVKLRGETPYPPQAFEFVRQGLAHTVQIIHGEIASASSEHGEHEDATRHVSGRQLCFGLKDYAIQRYGLLARTVLRSWSINRTEDFGRIVFAMVDAGLMRKTDEDSIEDFQGVFEFDEAFESPTPATRVGA